MTVRTLSDKMQLKLLTGEEGLDNEVQGGHVGDLLSFVMSHAKEKNVWVTIQGHINSVAVASLLGLSAIILSENVVPDEEMLKKANEEGIPILSTPLSSFDTICAFSRCNQIVED